MRGKRGMQRVQNGAQTVREYNHHKAGTRSVTHTVDDVDERLKRRLWRYRMDGAEYPATDKVLLSRLVDTRYQSNDPSVAGEPVLSKPQPPVTEPVLVDVFLWKHIVCGLDASTGRLTYVSIDAVYIIAKFPANDPLVMLQRMAENRTKLSTILTHTMNHMNLVLGKPSCAFDQLFNTDRAGAADLVCEARMVEGFFRYCHTQGIRNVNLGGLRMDVASWPEMQLWKRYVDTVVDARRTHFQTLTDLALQDRANNRDSRLPVESWPLDYFHGVNFRKVPLAQLHEELAQLKRTWKEGEEAESAEASTLDWIRSQVFDADGTHVLLCEGEAFARNCGIWFKIKTDSKRSEEEERVEQMSKRGKSEDSLLGTMSQPQQDVSMVRAAARAMPRACGEMLALTSEDAFYLCRAQVRLFLSNRCAEQDPLDEFMASDVWIPDVEWLAKEMHKIKQVDAVQWLKDAIGEYQLVLNTKRLQQTDTRRAELFRLVGKEKHPLRATLAHIAENAHIEVIMRAQVLKINSAINQNLQVMRSCELLQFRMAAMSVEDLKKQSAVADKWLADFTPQHNLEHNVLVGDACAELLAPEMLLAHFWALSAARIDVDLSYMNQLLMLLDRACMITHCMNTPGAYGQTLRVMDMAGTVNVLKEPEQKNHMRQTELYMYDPKFAGAGLDQTKGNKGQQENAHLNFNCLTPALQKEAVNNCDHSMRNVSKLSYTTLMGSGVLMNGEGVILGHQRAHQTELGLCCYWSEFGKEGAEASTMGWIEATMAHSGNADTGTGAGVKEASWNTTVQLENQSVCQLRKLPVTIITGNRPCNATPASAIEGARWITVASSTQCKQNGLTIVRDGGPAEDPALDGGAELRSQVALANDMSTGDVRSDIRLIDRVTAQSNMLYFLLLQWMRKDVTLLCSSLTVDPRPFSYTLRTNYRNMECAVGRLASGLRRAYLANANVWHRNAVGPWSRVLQVSTHVSNTMGVALLRAMRGARAGGACDLLAAYVLGVKSLLTQPISMLAMLASLHMWLAAAVLDINVMIVCCYVYHFTGFQHSCSLRVLSLVLAGHFETLGEDERDAYLGLCEFLLPCLLEEPPRAGQGPVPVLRGVLEQPSKTVLEKWANWHIPASDQEIRSSFAARAHGPLAQVRSTYCQPPLRFVNSEYIRGLGRPADGGHNHAPDKNVCGAPQRTLATMFALQQREEAHRRRVCDGAVALEREDTTRFWANVRAGTALPAPNINTNDVFKLRFPFVAHTGVWWDEAMQTAGACEGVVKQFLLQSGLPPNTTHHDLFTRLLEPFLRCRGLAGRVYGGPAAPGAHRNAWMGPVLDARLNALEFCSNPSISPQGKLEGIEVNLCMRLVHYVVLQGLGMTRDWSPAAHENASFVSCVHLRNMSHVSLGCLSLLLHTSVDKALVPANSGLLHLPVPSPVLNARSAAAIEYDPRLHVDTHTARADGASENMLSVSARFASTSNWVLLELAQHEHFLLYKSVADAWPEMRNARARHDLFPFPPESVAHAAHAFSVVQGVARRWASELAAQAPAEPEARLRHARADPACALRYHNELFPALLLLGASAGAEQVAHEQCALTRCSVQDGRELPCMTWEHGLLFTARVEGRRVALAPTVPTHAWPDAAAMASGDVAPFVELPLPAGASVCLSEFYELLKHGVVMGADGGIELDLGPHKRAGARSLPCVLCPVVHWPVLLLLVPDGWSVPGRAALALRPAAALFAAHAARGDMRSVAAGAALPELEDVEPALLARAAAALPGAALHFVAGAVWLERADAPLALFGSAAEFCHAALVPEEDGSRATELVAEHSEFGLCQVRQLASGRHAARYWKFWTRAALEARCEDARRAARAAGGAAAAAGGGAAAEAAADAAEALREAEALLAGAPAAGARTYAHQTLFDPAECPARFAPTGAGAGAGAAWGLVLEREGRFLAAGRYAVSVLDPRGGGALRFEMDFASMSRSMLQEGSELWIGVNDAVYACILREAHAQGTKVMLPVSPELHARLLADGAVSRQLRAFYVLGGSSSVADIGDNTISVVVIVASKSCAPGRKSAVDDAADAASRVNVTVAHNDMKLLSIRLPIYAADGSPVVSYHREAALPFYRYLREDSTSRARGA